MRESKRRGGVFVGVSSLLVIFIVLCLTTFAALSLTSANADLRMAKRAARAVSDYYAADSAAVELLARLDAALRSGADAPMEADLAREGETVTASFSVPVSDAQELRVRVRFPAGGGRYEILQWQAASTQEWAGGETIELWDGIL